MENPASQSDIDAAISSGEAEIDMSQPIHGLVLSINEGSALISKMDQLWVGGNELLVPLDKKIKTNPTPTFKIDQYLITPTYRQKRVRNGKHLYDFIYTPK